jgi:transketolase
MAHFCLRTNLFIFGEGVRIRVVSVPSTNRFSAQSDEYCEHVLPSSVPLPVIEAGISLGWRSHVGPQIAVIGFDSFGASAPGPVVMEHYGFTVNNICSRTRHLLFETQRPA